MFSFEVPTQERDQFVEITEIVQRQVTASRIQSGFVLVYVPHTTAGVTINENADPDVVHDLLLTLRRLIPKDAPGYRHAEENSDSHVKASLMGSSCPGAGRKWHTGVGVDGKASYFCEFDGPRRRTCPPASSSDNGSVAELIRRVDLSGRIPKGSEKRSVGHLFLQTI